MEFRTKQDAQKALTDLHESMLDGRKLYLKKDDQNHVFPPLKSKRDYMLGSDDGRNSPSSNDYRYKNG